MPNNKPFRTRTFLILGAALLAAAWMIGGPSVLRGFDWHPKLVNFLVFMPSILMVFWSISGQNKFLSCEHRAFKKMLGLSRP
ncbi:MAG: hypothetical protein JKY25_11825 [Robiginitomaculum sp.]|nr:hypothetical protein [Robiginitomaculum sp.]